jgi:hypothetical protein
MPCLILLLALAFLSIGCQTFSLTKEDFEKQQRGEMVDPETGRVVGMVGYAAYLGAAIGAMVAGR